MANGVAMITVLLLDPVDRGEPAAKWAKENCTGFVDWRCVDVADFSYQYDEIAEYIFDNKEDSVLFKMVWW